MSTLSAKLTLTLKNAPMLHSGRGQRKRNLKCFGDILDTPSGGDNASLLRDFFSSRGGRPLLEQLGLEPHGCYAASTRGWLVGVCVAMNHCRTRSAWKLPIGPFHG